MIIEDWRMLVQNDSKRLEVLRKSMWKELDLTVTTYEYLNEMINEGRIRTKPETIGLLHECMSKTGQVIWTEDQLASVFHTSEDMDNIYFRVTGRVIRNGVIEEKVDESV